MAEETEELEVSFRLDEEGRTIPPPSSSSPGFQTSATLDYTARTDCTALQWVGARLPEDGGEDESVSAISGNTDWEAKALDELLLDAEISDCGLMPRTFWIPATGFVPRFSLEQLALDVFERHTSAVPCGSFDPSTSGAEWWVQIRPSPETTGRYSMHASKNDEGSDKADCNTDDCVKKGGISFHWDKDEDLRVLTGGTTYVHPHLSTVTYLTGIGAPTLAINYRVHNLTGDALANPEPEAFLSWPAQFKHLAFDGRYLHAAPADLMKKGAWDAQTTVPPELAAAAPEAEQKKLRRRHRRVTFLVNIWLNYHPFNVHPFPETMVDKMSGCPAKRRVGLAFRPAPPEQNTASATTTDLCDGLAKPQLPTISVRIGGTEEEPPAVCDNDTYTWPMGNYESGERIRMSLPTQRIRSVASAGGNVRIRWSNGEGSLSNQAGVELLKERESGTDGANPSSSSSPPREDDTDEPSPKRARESVETDHTSA
jgi:hypothetical protein